MKSKGLFLIVLFMLCFSSSVSGKELLVNGDFEIGEARDDKAPSFSAKAWRRQLWKPYEFNSWLTDGTRDRVIGEGNQAAKFRWGASHIYQFFTATPNNEYSFSAEYFLRLQTSRWQARIQVEWLNAAGKSIGSIITVAEADNNKAVAAKWNKLKGVATAPEATAYARILLNVNNRGEGNMWAPVYIDNASVTGEPGTHNLPVTFRCSPYQLTLNAINESEPYRVSLTDFAGDKDGDKLKFAMVAGPKWLKVKSNGKMSGKPKFEDAGDNKIVLKVEDGRGSSDQCTMILPVTGRLRLGNLFDEDMVLQHGKAFTLFGKALPNSPVKVAMSTGEEVEGVSDDDGNWSVELPALRISKDGLVKMTVESGSRKLILSNLLVGDVWFCSGQSNMAWGMKNTDGSKEAIESSADKYMRIITAPETGGVKPWDDLRAPAKWNESKPSTVEIFSAVAYYFGKNLRKELEIPIGLIVSSQGGTSIEIWAKELRKKGSKIPYNSRVHPFTKLPIKGAIWYQAEANINDGSKYTGKMQTLVGDWREEWGIGEFPFYFVQLAAYGYKGDDPYKLPEIWAAQTKAMEMIPNTGMAVITDVSNVKNIHPTNKAPVGRRLALWALHGTYGKKGIVYAGPFVRDARIENGKVRVSFDHPGTGLVSRDGHPINGFDLAGSDGNFFGATAVIDGKDVVVSANEVKDPQWVRFAWHDTACSNLMNKEGFPANSFKKKL